MNKNLPSSQKALSLLFECGCSKKVVAHCKAVSALAVKFAEACKKNGQDVDVELVEVGALLHDIGRSKTHSINHSIVGVEIAQQA
ncbi:MAG: HDIG domain-containing metalloprotein, partial [Candidatus Bathyarchaeia archaeon]